MRNQSNQHTTISPNRDSMQPLQYYLKFKHKERKEVFRVKRVEIKPLPQKENLMRKPTANAQHQQVRKQGKQERRRKRKSRQSPGTLRRNQIHIGKKLMAGEVPLVCATAWGYVDQLLTFMHMIGFFAVLNIDGQRFERKMVSVCQLLATYELKVILGIVSINQVGAKLF